MCDRLKCWGRQGPVLQRGELEELRRVVREVEELHGVTRAGAAGDGELVRAPVRGLGGAEGGQREEEGGGPHVGGD